MMVFHSIDLSLSGIQEWLKGVAQRLSLKLDVQRVPETSIFLVHDGFYVEICCQDKDKLTSVKLSQANTTQVSYTATTILSSIGSCVKYQICDLKLLHAALSNLIFFGRPTY